MKLEPNRSDIFIPLADQVSSADVPPREMPRHDLVVTHPPANLEEGEDVALAKAPTLMMNTGGTAESDPYAPSQHRGDSIPRHYIQGIVMSHRACIITNLIGNGSQTLFQAQMVWTIGRNREAALPLRDRVLSRRHAVILYLPEDGFYLIDLNSMNGSYLNGVRLQQRQLLHDGDLIRMGNIEFTFYLSQSCRSVEAIHPEVLARFITPSSRSEKFIDYSELEEPEILFSTTREP